MSLDDATSAASDEDVIMGKTAKAMTAAEELVTRLSKIEAKTPIVVSCYLRVDPAARRNRAYLVEFLQRVKGLEASLDAREVDADSRKQIAADIERITRWLARPGKAPELAGVAIFAAKSLGLFETVPLARVHRNRIDVDTRPLLQELLDARETLGHYLGVAIDRERARFFHVAAAHTEELTALVPFASRGGKFRGRRREAPGAGEFRWHQRIEDEKHRHYASVAAEIGRLLRARPYRGIALIGPEEHTAALHAFLPLRLQAICLGTGKLNPRSVTPAEIARLTWQLQRSAESREEMELLRRVSDGVGTGWAVNGLRDTLRALSLGQVRELIVPDRANGTGFRCASGALALSTVDCSDGKPATAVAHLVDEAIEDALRQRAEVVVIDDPEASGQVQGLAATLRFRS
jgi:peptide chain release factor subunit 1